MAIISKFTRGAVAGNGWTNATNATADDGVYATCAPAKGSSVAGQWDFAAFSDAEIPVGSTINSVTLEAQFKVSTTSSIATFNLANIVGGIAGTNLADTTEPLADKIVTNASWISTPNETNLKTAGACIAAISGQRGNSNTGVTFSLDYIKITVDYTAASPNRTGTIAITQAQSISASGTVTPPAVTGTAAITQAQSLQASGKQTFRGAGGIMQPQSLSASGKQKFIGAGAVTQGQSISATGSTTAPTGISGSAAIVQAQSLSLSGRLAFRGSGALVQSQGVAASGLLKFRGAIAITQAQSIYGTSGQEVVHMSQAKSSSPATLNNRRLAADAILRGYDDGDIATVLSNARTAGYPAAGMSETVADSQVGGIVAGINR